MENTTAEKKIVAFYGRKPHYSFRTYAEAITKEFFPLMESACIPAPLYYQRFNSDLSGRAAEGMYPGSVIAMYNFCREYHEKVIAPRTDPERLLERFQQLSGIDLAEKTLSQRMEYEAIYRYFVHCAHKAR